MQCFWPSCLWRAKVQTKSLIKWQLGKRDKIIFALVFHSFLHKSICLSRNEKNHTCCYKLVNVLFIFNLFTVKCVAVRLNKGTNWQEKKRQLLFIHLFFSALWHFITISLNRASLHCGNYTCFILMNWSKFKVNHERKGQQRPYTITMPPFEILISIVITCFMNSINPPKTILPVWHHWLREDKSACFQVWRADTIFLLVVTQWSPVRGVYSGVLLTYNNIFVISVLGI